MSPLLIRRVAPAANDSKALSAPLIWRPPGPIHAQDPQASSERKCGAELLVNFPS